MDFIRCLIRDTLVANNPEETVRQNLLSWMIQEGGYPKGLIAIEQELYEGPKNLKRRLDLLILKPNSLKPLLLIECKSVKLTSTHLNQLLGYNVFVRAPYLLLVNQKSAKFGFIGSQGNWVFEEKLPLYSEIAK